MREVLEYAERLGLDRADVQRYLWAAQHGHLDHARRGLEFLLEQEGHAMNGLADPFEPWPSAETLYVENGVDVGNEHHTGDPVYVGLEELGRGVLILGAHGAGKTTLGYVLLSALEAGL